MSTVAIVLLCCLAALLVAGLVGARLMDARRARRAAQEDERLEPQFDQRRLEQDEEKFAEQSTDPRNRMR